MSDQAYSRPPAAGGMLRLHLNENTGGCSPDALAAVRALSAQDLARYPEYDEAIAAVARAFEVPPEFVLLTNGLDEGILAVTAAAFRRRDGLIPEAIGVRPAFEMYEITVNGLGGRMRTVPLDASFAWSAEALAALSGAATRIFFVTNPHNPSGRGVARSEILALAVRAKPAMLFVDEAYADFTGQTVIDAGLLLNHPNVIVGRTFSKVYGLAGLRIGALVGAPEALAPVRRVVPPYSVNAVAAAVLPAALADVAHTASYIEASRRSRQRLIDACRRLGATAFPSDANFMLLKTGDSAPALVAALAARRIAVRDKSGTEGCAGCIRVTAGLVEDTDRLIEALEDAWRELHG